MNKPYSSALVSILFFAVQLVDKYLPKIPLTW